MDVRHVWSYSVFKIKGFAENSEVAVRAETHLACLHELKRQGISRTLLIHVPAVQIHHVFVL